jgi:hypothetical protein
MLTKNQLNYCLRDLFWRNKKSNKDNQFLPGLSQLAN